MLLRRYEDDLLAALVAVADGHAPPAPRFSTAAAVAVVMASAGYPDGARKGDPITGIAAAELDPAVVVFHAGTALAGEQLVTAGGRVLAVSATGHDLPAARRTAYAAVQKISFPGAQFRSDIGDRDG